MIANEGQPNGADRPYQHDRPDRPYRPYRIDMKYVGADFHGWQTQPSGVSIQDHLEKALATILRHDVRVTGASRTDSGVHAEHQVGLFHTPSDYHEFKWINSLHGLLPPSIGVTSIKPAPLGFHPVLAAKGKAYRYTLWLGTSRNPMITPYCWQLFPDLDLDLMRKEAKALIGTHDFSAFCAADSSAKTRHRTVLEVEIINKPREGASPEALGPLVEIWVIGHGFLKQMVRIIVGTLVQIGLGRLPEGSMAEIIASKDRKKAGKTAPALGLTLVEIFYDEIPRLAELRERSTKDFSFRV